jgi:hypothetical protein
MQPQNDNKAYKLDDNFTILHALKMVDDVLILCLQENMGCKAARENGPRASTGPWMGRENE